MANHVDKFNDYCAVEEAIEKVCTEYEGEIVIKQKMLPPSIHDLSKSEWR